MPIHLNHSEAERILKEEAQRLEQVDRVAERGYVDLEETWRERVQRLGELCPYRKSSTFVAALGVAILGKATDIRVDSYCLLDRDGGERAWSARSLADGVWAKQRVYLRVDLGANGPNPLNNTPFIGKSRIDQIENARNRQGFEFLCECLDELERLPSESQARAALRGFIAARRVGARATFIVGEYAGDHFTVPTLAGAIHEFVRADSEDGRRAQACAAGIVKACLGEAVVDVGHVNDPDRNFPLDIAVFAAAESPEVVTAIEVKDKPVDGAMILAAVEKGASEDVDSLVVLAVAEKQIPANFLEEHAIARDLGRRLIYVEGWTSFLQLCIGLRAESGLGLLTSIYVSVGATLVEMGVSAEGVADWEHLATQSESASP